MPLLAAALILPGLAAATEVPGLGPVDPRRPVPFAEPPWNAIALVETRPGGRCSGVAIGPRVVLTAAHCLVTSDGRGIVPPGDVAVRLGGAVARGTALAVGPGFDPAREEPWRADWALVTLAAPIGQGRTLPLLREAPSNGAPLSLPAWQHDRPDVLLADRGCRVVMVGTFGAQGILVGHNCAGTVGSSGAPLLLPVAGGYAIAGVQVKAALGQPLGLAVPGFTIPLPAAPEAPAPASREGRAAPPPSRR
ncbi:trypsin-like serine protease [Roseomonas sp. PWR1]|uniref:Trypsin-like serine protease n=1 Tax=Roseomonas nitratireducens TaxID=2820810 RepID=A0ABS4AXZ9_9PROT|nr:trypsin-like serine protease [Neoroseomonas nitratireducens]